MVDLVDRAALAEVLAEAERTAHPVAQLTANVDLSLRDAYAVQLAGARRRSDLGDPAVGIKLGFTSKEKARQMGVDDVILGVLSASGDLGGSANVSLGSMIHPRIEPEVAFLLGPEVADLDLADASVSLVDHVTHVAVAVEIIDSRYLDFRFTVEDVVADNTSAARFRVGEWHPFAPLRHRLDDLPVSLYADGEQIAAGSTHAILEGPLNALDEAQRLAVEHGHSLPGPCVLLAGAATAAVAMAPGVTYEAEVSHLGRVSVVAGL